MNQNNEKTKRKIILKSGEELYFPNGIEFNSDHSSGEINLHIKNPDYNMQEDGAAFEAWSLIIKVKTGCRKVILSFEEKHNIHKNKLNSTDPSKQHYMRFLYRVMKFQEQMSSWFIVSSKSDKALNLFKDIFLSESKTNNTPRSTSNYSKAEEKGKEHVLEKAFLNITSFRNSTGIDYELSDQLPTGIFSGEVKEDNKIFNTGYFDLWGKDPVNQEFNIFELKEPGNTKVGIISELFFYSNLAYDLLHEKNNFVLNKSKTEYRNYHIFLSLKNAKVNAHFLVNKLHPEFENNKEDLIRILNENSPISYSIVKYAIDDSFLSSIKMKLADRYKDLRNP